MAGVSGEQLDGWIQSARTRSFEWGKWDCVLMAADWVAYVTGSDIAEPYRGKYSTEAEAYSVIGDDFGGGIAAIPDSYLMSSHPSRIQRGDVVVCIYRDHMPCLGVYCGGSTMIATERGTLAFPSSSLKVERNWKPCLKQQQVG